jgi:hypothetical protein
MSEEIELSVLDLRYESCRMRVAGIEARLLSSIAERGIEEPLEGVGKYLLLNGFKRYRCAVKLKLTTVPYISLGTQECVGIINLLRSSNERALSILEQAAFVDQLKDVHGMSLGEIAIELSRSKAWVCMRAGLIDELSTRVREKLFNGAFPVYSYMYTLRAFMRMNGVTREDIEEFVEAVSGRTLSVRDIELLAEGYFRGPKSLRAEVFSGHITLALRQMKQLNHSGDGYNEFERVFLRDLGRARECMQRVVGRSQRLKLTSFIFYTQLMKAAEEILNESQTFINAIQGLYGRSR